MTDSDAKEWVTIKIPKSVRDDARPDPRTYGDIMLAGLDTDAEGDDVPEELRDQLDRIEAAATTAEERTNQLESTLEELQR